MFKLLAFLVMVAIAIVVVSAEIDGADARRAAALSASTHAAFAAPPAMAARRRRCDRNYRGRCLRPNVSDYDCAGGRGNGPYYVRGPFTVVGTDHYRLDSDGDGIACES